MHYIWFWVHWLAEHILKSVNINLPNLFDWLQETLRKEQKLFGSSSFYLESKLSEKNKQH